LAAFLDAPSVGCLTSARFLSCWKDAIGPLGAESSATAAIAQRWRSIGYQHDGWKCRVACDEPQVWSNLRTLPGSPSVLSGAHLQHRIPNIRPSRVVRSR